MSGDELARTVGPVVLFIGQECQHWQVADFVNAARFAHALGADSIAAKRADGGIRWYESPEHLQAEREAVLAVGCGYLPFLYSYGPRFGLQQISDEVALLAEMGKVNDNLMTVDMEVEWNNAAPDALARFADEMAPVPGELIISTWADPRQQGWVSTIQGIKRVANAWGPQEYNSWLAAQEWQDVLAGETVIFPELDLSQEFGQNDPLALVDEGLSRGHRSFWLWELSFAKRNPALVRSIAARVHAHVLSLPEPLTEPDGVVVSGPGDTALSIAQATGVTPAHVLGNNAYALGSHSVETPITPGTPLHI